MDVNRWYLNYLIKSAAKWERRIGNILSAKGLSAMPKSVQGYLAQGINANPESMSVISRRHIKNLLKELDYKNEARDRQLRSKWRESGIPMNKQDKYVIRSRGNSFNALTDRELTRQREIIPTERALGKLVPVGDALSLTDPKMRSVKGLLVKSKAYPGYHPEKTIYHGVSGSSYAADIDTAREIFATPHPSVAAQYAGDRGLILAMKRPNDAVYTPHIAAIDSAERARKTKNMKRLKATRESLADMSNLIDYETIVRQDPKAIKSVYRVMPDGREARQMATSTKAGPGMTLTWKQMAERLRQERELIRNRKDKGDIALEELLPVRGLQRGN